MLKHITSLAIVLLAALPAAAQPASDPAEVDAVVAAVKAANPDFKSLCQKGPDGIRKASLADRSQLYLELASGPFYGFNRPGAKVSQGLIDSWWAQGMQGGHKNTYDSIAAFSATDFRGDLEKFDIPTLVIHGDDDQIVPIDLSGRASAALVKGAKLIVYAGAPHGLTDTHKDRVNQDLLAFLRE